jgi:hypothetical protein
VEYEINLAFHVSYIPVQALRRCVDLASNLIASSPSHEELAFLAGKSDFIATISFRCEEEIVPMTTFCCLCGGWHTIVPQLQSLPSGLKEHPD